MSPCQNCRHFYITWDNASPRGCRAFGFKTRGIPSDVVQQSTGYACQKFVAKPEPQPARTEPVRRRRS